MSIVRAHSAGMLSTVATSDTTLSISALTSAGATTRYSPCPGHIQKRGTHAIVKSQHRGGACRTGTRATKMRCSETAQQRQSRVHSRKSRYMGKCMNRREDTTKVQRTGVATGQPGSKAKCYEEDTSRHCVSSPSLIKNSENETSSAREVPKTTREV